MARLRLPCGEVVLEPPVADHVAAILAPEAIRGGMVQASGIASRGSAAAHKSSPEETVMQTCNPAINQSGRQSAEEPGEPPNGNPRTSPVGPPKRVPMRRPWPEKV
jgi:hypothetical protein